MILQLCNFAANLSYDASGSLPDSPSPTTCGVILVAQSGSSSYERFDGLVPSTSGSEARRKGGIEILIPTL